MGVVCSVCSIIIGVLIGVLATVLIYTDDAQSILHNIIWVLEYLLSIIILLYPDDDDR